MNFCEETSVILGAWALVFKSILTWETSMIPQLVFMGWISSSFWSTLAIVLATAVEVSSWDPASYYQEDAMKWFQVKYEGVILNKCLIKLASCFEEFTSFVILNSMFLHLNSLNSMFTSTCFRHPY